MANEILEENGNTLLDESGSPLIQEISAHYAHITGGVVDQVIKISKETIEARGGWECYGCGGAFKSISEWKQTSYNSKGGTHVLGGTPLRKNFAGIGFTYDSGRDAFIPPYPTNGQSYVLNETTCLWDLI